MTISNARFYSQNVLIKWREKISTVLCLTVPLVALIVVLTIATAGQRRASGNFLPFQEFQILRHFLPDVAAANWNFFQFS